MGAMVRADYTLGEMAWDNLLSELSLIVDCAERFLDLGSELVADGELWKYPLPYTKASSHGRARQTLTVWQGGQITEGLLARLRTSQPSVLAEAHIKGAAEKQKTESADPVDALLEHAHRIAKRRGVVGRSLLAVQGHAQIRSTFTVSLGVVYQLFAVICHYRDPHTRRRALRLLEICNRHEGLWDSKLTAQSAKRRMMVEETQALDLLREETGSKNAAADTEVIEIKAASQIPNPCRVRATGQTFLPYGRVLERFCMG